MFKIGDKVVCRIDHPTVGEMTNGTVCTVKEVRHDPRDDTKWMISLEESVGIYSSGYFVLHNMYFRKDKIKKLQKKIRRDRILHLFSF